MIFREALEEVKPEARYSLQIFATDLDKDAIDKARNGLFANNIAAVVSESRLHRFFARVDHSYQVSKELRDTIIFAVQNLIMDPPFTKLDLLVCRNLLIYLGAELQKKLIPLFHYSLNSGGILLLGTSESIGAAPNLFSPIPGKERLYRRHDSAQRADLDAITTGRMLMNNRELPQPAPAAAAQLAASLQDQVKALLLKSYCPAAVLTFSGRFRNWLLRHGVPAQICH